MMRARLLELLGTPGLIGALALLIGTAIHRRPQGWRRWILAALVTAAVVVAASVSLLERPEPLGPIWLSRAETAYDSLWRSLDEASLAGASTLESLDLESHDRLDVFERLERLAADRDVTFLLLDPDGEASVWAGDGLLHALERHGVPSTGPVFQSSFSAVSLGSVRRVGLQSTSWRLLAGKSYSSLRLPFVSPGGGRRSDFSWAVVAEGTQVPERSTALVLEGRPTMAISPDAVEGSDDAPRRLRPLRIGWIAVGLGMLLLAGCRRERAAQWIEPGTTALLILGVASLGIAAALDLLHVGLLAAACSIVWSSGIVGGSIPAAWLRLATAPVALCLVAAMGSWLEKSAGPVDLSQGLLGDAQTTSLRLTVLAIALAGLLPSGLGRGSAASKAPDSGMSRSVPSETLRGALCLTLLGIAIVSLAHPVAASLSVLAAALAGAWWLVGWQGTGKVLRGLCSVALAALLGAVTWQVMHRYLETRYLARDVAPQLGPPTASERERLDEEVRRYFGGFDLSQVAPVHPWELDALDLAYVLWSRSPLAVKGRLSSLTVLVDGVPLSNFEFGLPTTPDGAVDRSPIVWQELAVPGWDEALVTGEAALLNDGTRQGTLRWAVLPRPGFRLVDGPVEQLAATLVRGSLSRNLPIDRLIQPASFAVYSDMPRPTLGAADAPLLDPDVLARKHFVIESGGQRVEGWADPGPEATEVLLLTAPRSLVTLERVALQAVGTLTAIGGLSLLVILLAPPDPSRLRLGWSRLYRSYSKKLLLVYATMLLVPLLAVTLALLGVVGKRLERTREEAGEAAVDAAQHVLGEYVLSLDPGFGVDTAIDDTLLDWLSRVIHHEVNLYWGSDLYASSNPELFTAGFLPERIPGEIYSALTLDSIPLARRINRASGEAYLELYAPLRIPGVRSQELLFLSIPLLAQQEEAQGEIATLRARAVLAALLLLVAAVITAGRLSRSFTRPLTDLIAGTESIAAGARSLDLEPTELELAALVNAINRMAERIAEARERLTVEKRVIEKVVENITAGVVSLDAAGRVLLANGVAKSLLGVEVGARLEASLGDEPHWEPLADWLRSAPRELVHRTVSVPEPQGESREWTVIWVPVPGEGEPSSLLVVEDVTEVLRGQRLRAWAEMARIIAHEIKNPLTPIRLSTQHMVEVHERDPQQFDRVFEICSRNILRQVDELQAIAGEFSTYSRIPQIRPERGDLVEALGEVVESYRVAPPAGIDIALSTDRPEAPCEFDRRLLGRAVRNLIENAIRASRGGGEIQVRLEHADGDLVVHVEDRGPGVDPEILGRLFDPYFSTDSSGTGLGLPITRRIVEEHGGSITAENRPGGGLRVSFRLPAEDAPRRA